MGRSNTAPIDDKVKRNGTMKSPSRSATVPQQPPREKAYHNHKLPNLPFHHRNYTAPSSSLSRKSSPTGRPAPPNRENSAQTRYVNMLLGLDTIPRLHNILASFFTWILLAGFLIFPGTFTTFQNTLSSEDNPSQAASKIATAIKHVQLLVLAAVCSGIGTAGMLWLWWRWRQNYVWLLNRIFLPGCLNSLAGLISTLVGVYGQQQGVWNVTARVTAAVTGGILVITGILFAIYNFVVLRRIKSKHRKEMEGTHEGETFVEKMGRVAQKPALGPGSVV